LSSPWERKNRDLGAILGTQNDEIKIRQQESTKTQGILERKKSNSLRLQELGREV
jgi:hypothetical protein